MSLAVVLAMHGAPANDFPPEELAGALREATGKEAIVVVTPMMTRTGEHSEADIPKAIERAVRRHPAISFRYAWPFKPSEVARFLAAQLDKVPMRSVSH